MTTATLSNNESQSYRDGKKYLWLLGLSVPLFPVIGYGLWQASGFELGLWFTLLFVYGVLPVLDYFIGEDVNNPPESAVPQLESDRFYRSIVYLFIPMQFAVFIWGAWGAVNYDMSWFGWLGFTLSIGGVGGVGINTAHELGHKKPELERWLSKIALAPVAYGHFFVEHNKGHHRRVATPEDPASSRMGETLYGFLPRTIIGSYRSAIEIERSRLDRLGKSWWSLENDILQAWAMTVVLWGALILWLGLAVIPFLLLQAVYGFSLLEVVNYLEHYGLVRQKGENGRYERTQPEHSWNSNHIVTNLFLYQLQRHSDHHANPTRRYQALREFRDAPKLPSGYAAMLLLAYIPPLWRKVMDPKVVAHYEGDLRKANLLPSKREELLAKYPPPAAA